MFADKLRKVLNKTRIFHEFLKSRKIGNILAHQSRRIRAYIKEPYFL